MLSAPWQVIRLSSRCIKRKRYTTRWPLHTGNIYANACFTRRQCMNYVLAVDGGNTKTIALVAALDGTILGAGRGGCADIYNAPAGTQWPNSASAAMANVEYAVRSALQAAQVKASDLVTAVFNMAGADWPEDFAYIQAAMEERGFGRTILVQNDALGILHAGSADATGVSVGCGTGAATGARSADGRTWHSSMWQNQVQ